MVDAVEFRDAQRQQWDTAATGWDKWSELMAGATQVVSDRLVEMAGVDSGARVLDVACGLGEPTLTAARAAGEGGAVVATDIAPDMIARARKRAAAEGIENVEFVEIAANSLDFPDSSFDAAVSRWGIIFEPDGEAVAAKVRRFLKPGGRMAISSWGTPDEVPMLSIPMRTVMERLDVPPPPPGTPGPLSRPTPDAIGGLLTDGGFSDVEVDQADVILEWESPEQFTTFVREIAPPISALMASHPADVQADTWAAITAAVREASGGDGPVRQTNLALLAVGRA
jgi:ubiquinone/menaquinone biosynthesis C-methylase UbiE